MREKNKVSLLRITQYAAAIHGTLETRLKASDCCTIGYSVDGFSRWALLLSVRSFVFLPGAHRGYGMYCALQENTIIIIILYIIVVYVIVVCVYAVQCLLQYKVVIC